MMIIVFAIFIVMSIVVFAFFAYIPNMHYLIENDLLRRANSNVALYAMQYGQLARRAGVISMADGKKKTITLPDMGYLKKTGNKEIDKFTCDINLVSENNEEKIKLNIKHGIVSQ